MSTTPVIPALPQLRPLESIVPVAPNGRGYLTPETTNFLQAFVVSGIAVWALLYALKPEWLMIKDDAGRPTSQIDNTRLAMAVIGGALVLAALYRGMGK